MKHIFAIIKKELKDYFNSPLAYVFISIFLVVSNWLFFRSFFIQAQASMRPYFSLLPWLFLFLIPAVTMRLWAEEKKLNTAEVLFTWSIKDPEAILGKFFASLIFIALTLILSLSVPLSISFIGGLDWGIVIASYLGALLLAAAFLAIGLFISSLTDNQIIAFILAVALAFAIFMVGEDFVLYALPNYLVNLAQYLGLGAHFASINRGVLDSRDIIYYLSIIFIFLYLNTRQIASRKWK
ncbi:MAG: ABC transporter [Candidatus Parcubacteria bacterium]|nr:ABC transporter [Candidatus Parcubacteria bacterium]